METTATLKHVRFAPQKGRLVADQIRGLNVSKALDILSFSPKRAASTIKKILNQRFLMLSIISVLILMN